MKMRVILEVEVDQRAWADEYGLTLTEAEADAPEHITALLGAAVDEKAQQMGTFSVRHMSTQVFHTGALSR